MFNNKLTKKILSITGAIAIMGAMAIPSLAASNTPVKGQTNVFYSSGNIVPGPSGTSWGVEIPSGVSFTDKDLGVEKKGPEYNIRLVSLDANGKELTEVYNTLKVKAQVTSQNGFKFVKDGAGQGVGSYKFTADGTAMQAVNTIQDISEMDVTTQKTEIKGGFTLNEVLNEKGNYKDILTFTFTETASSTK